MKYAQVLEVKVVIISDSARSEGVKSEGVKVKVSKV